MLQPLGDRSSGNRYSRSLNLNWAQRNNSCQCHQYPKPSQSNIRSLNLNGVPRSNSCQRRQSPKHKPHQTNIRSPNSGKIPKCSISLRASLRGAE